MSELSVDADVVAAADSAELLSSLPHSSLLLSEDSPSSESSATGSNRGDLDLDLPAIRAKTLANFQ